MNLPSLQNLASKLLLLVINGVGLSALPAFAEVTLPHIFGDNMVLQRDMPIPVWGSRSLRLGRASDPQSSEQRRASGNHLSDKPASEVSDPPVAKFFPLLPPHAAALQPNNRGKLQSLVVAALRRTEFIPFTRK